MVTDIQGTIGHTVCDSNSAGGRLGDMTDPTGDMKIQTYHRARLFAWSADLVLPILLAAREIIDCRAGG